MGVDERNIPVMDGCRNYNGKLSNNYSDSKYLQETIMVYKLRKLYPIICLVHDCL